MSRLGQAARTVFSSYALTAVLAGTGVVVAGIELNGSSEDLDLGTAAGLLIAAAGQATGARLARDGARSAARSLCRQVDAGLRRYHTAITELEQQRQRMEVLEDLYRQGRDPGAAQQLEAAVAAFDTAWAAVAAAREALLDVLTEAATELPADFAAPLARITDEVATRGADHRTVAPVSEDSRAAFRAAARVELGVPLR